MRGRERSRKIRGRRKEREINGKKNSGRERSRGEVRKFEKLRKREDGREVERTREK